MTTQKTLLTADEFYDFCCQNDGRYELVKGEVVELSPVNDEHSGIASNIKSTAFNNYSRRPISVRRGGSRLQSAFRPGHGARP